MYHYIRTFNKNYPYLNFLDFEDFKKQNNYFFNNKEFVKITDDLDQCYSQDKYLLTFDDGLKEHLKVAKYLYEKNIIGIFFIPGKQLEKKDFLSIHKIHLIFSIYNSDQLISIFKKFNINTMFKKNIFTIFNKQKNFLDKKDIFTENNKKIFLKTILNNLDQKNFNIVKNIFNYCISKKKQKKIFENFYLNCNDIKEIHNLGMRIGGHSYSHRVLSKLNYNQQKNDISKSINILSKILKNKVECFSYPYGGFNVFNANTIKILKKKKIKYVFNVESKDWVKKSNKFYIPRYDCNKFKFGQIFKKLNLENDNRKKI
jgi:peptidoglycan/xylan/chitin deacetylase (PgdA/CDA1 family)